MFTYHYQQPEEYHFSLDSIHLAEFVAQELKTRTDLERLQVLDLCAGCGVVGIELSWYLRNLRHIDFIEVQNIYSEYFQKNIATVNRPELKTEWHLLNYDELLKDKWKNKYDLIVSNPPYFQQHQGMLSPSQFKNRCRFYLDSSFENFILAIANSLAPGGQGYFLLRSLKHHGEDLFSQIKIFLKNRDFEVNCVTQVRGTDVVLIKKMS